MELVSWLDDWKSWLSFHWLTLFRVFSILFLLTGAGIIVYLQVSQFSYREPSILILKNEKEESEGELVLVYPKWIYSWQGSDKIDIRFIPDNTLSSPVQYKVNIIEEQPEYVYFTEVKTIEIALKPPEQYENSITFGSRGIPPGVNEVTMRMEVWHNNLQTPEKVAFGIKVNHFSLSLPIISLAIGLLTTLLSTVGNRLLTKVVDKLISV